MNVMESVPIEDLCELSMGPFGSDVKKEFFTERGVPILSGSNIDGFYLNDSNLRFVSEDRAEHLARSLATHNDIVVTHRGTLGQVAIVPDNSKYEKYLISQSQFKITCNSARLLPKYLMYYLHTPIGQQKILSNKVQTGVPALARPTSTFKKIKVPMPPRDIQEAVVEVLDSFEAQIQCLIRTNGYLEQVCQTLFDEFDNDDSNPSVALSEVAEVNPKRTIRKGEAALCVEMSDLSTSCAFPSSWRVKPYNGGMKFINGDTVMARITPCLENGKVGYINFLNDGQTAFGSTEYIVLTTRGELPPEYFYFLSRNKKFAAFAVAHMNGSSGRQRVAGSDIKHYEIRVPSKNQLDCFKQIAEPAMRTVLANSLETRKLAELRDALLPKLMSGEIDVSEVEVPTPQTNSHLCD